MDRPGILNRMKHIPTRNSLFINANYTRRKEREGGREGGRVTPADALVPLPVSVICYLHLYTFFRFNKRRSGFSVTFMDGLFRGGKKGGIVTRNVCKKKLKKNLSIYI